MAHGFIIIFESRDDTLPNERHPSALVHCTRKQAEAARDRHDQVGKALDIIEITWNDSGANKPWPP